MLLFADCSLECSSVYFNCYLVLVSFEWQEVCLRIVFEELMAVRIFVNSKDKNLMAKDILP